MGLFSFLRKNSEEKTNAQLYEDLVIKTKEEKEKYEKEIADKNRKIKELEAQIEQLAARLSWINHQQTESSDHETTKTSPDIFFEDHHLSSEQVEVIQKITSSSDSFFVTGKAGTGKSTILRYLASLDPDNTLICAPTGIAAVNIGGATIHRVFRLPLGFIDIMGNKLKPLFSEEKDLLCSVQRIIIDEVSMVRADVMDAIDYRLKEARKNKLPFGGCQIVCFGDLYQLPPVVTSAEEIELFNDYYGTAFFFGAPAAEKSMKKIELNQVFRQKDLVFVRALNEIREAGENIASAIDFVNKNAGTAPIPEKTPRIVLINDQAEEINTRELSKLPGESKTYYAAREGEFPSFKTNPVCPIALELKVGATVMTLRNDKDKYYFNGSIGTVLKMEPDSVVISVGNKQVAVKEAVWQSFAYRRNKETGKLEKYEIGYIKQFPLKLAYAITAHKAQGQTFDDVIIDFSGRKAFAPGQTYVALSRCRFLERMHLTSPLKASDVFVDEEVKKYMHNH